MSHKKFPRPLLCRPGYTRLLNVISRKYFLRLCRSLGYPHQKKVLGTPMSGLLLLMGFCHGEVMNFLLPTYPHNGQGRGKSTSGRPPPLNPSELFTGQLFPTKPVIPGQQTRLLLQEIALEAEGHSRKHRGGENRAASQSDPPGW